MKLQAKFTIAFIGMVIFMTSISFFLINLNLQSQFNRFIEERNNQETTGLNHPPEARMMKGSPEQRFSQTVSDSLIWAGIIDILFAIILAYLLSRLLLQRIYRLQLAMDQYTKDGISKPVLHGNQDEVDNLANIYNLLIEKIEKEEKIRKDFFIDMSHELRTPLTSIKGYLEGLIDKVFDPEKEKDIYEKTLNETDRMIHLVKEMTTLAKLETGKIKLSTEVVNLRKLTKEVIEIFEQTSEEKGIDIMVEGDITATLDPYKFKQVIINLLDNALHYGSEKTAISIEMKRKGDTIHWQIKNKTTNIQTEDIEYFFERFYRGDKSRSYDSKKTHLGIGLNIVKKIVEQHHGKISVRMEGKYIVFEIELPQS